MNAMDSSSSMSGSSLKRADSSRSTSSSSRPGGQAKQTEELINALEAEEERLVNTLTRKLETLRAEKIELENVLEAESESLVLRLQRQLSLLMQQQQQAQSSVTSPTGDSASSPNLSTLLSGLDPLQPSPETMINVLQSENCNLRNRLVDTERDFIRSTRQNDVYRAELIALRQRAGISIDDLIGTAHEEGPVSASSARRRARGPSTSAAGIPIPGSYPRRHFTTAASPSSSAISFGQASSGMAGSSLPPSTPLSPNSLGDSPNLGSSGMGTTLTTPSTSYPGLPVPHTTPAASPVAARGNMSHYMSQNRNGPSNSSNASGVYPNAPPPSVAGTSAGSDIATPLSQSPSSRSNSLSRRISSGGGVRIAETGVLQPRRGRVGSVGGPGAPEDRQMPDRA